MMAKQWWMFREGDLVELNFGTEPWRTNIQESLTAKEIGSGPFCVLLVIRSDSGKRIDDHLKVETLRGIKWLGAGLFLPYGETERRMEIWRRKTSR